MRRIVLWAVLCLILITGVSVLIVGPGKISSLQIPTYKLPGFVLRIKSEFDHKSKPNLLVFRSEIAGYTLRIGDWATYLEYRSGNLDYTHEVVLSNDAQITFFRDISPGGELLAAYDVNYSTNNKRLVTRIYLSPDILDQPEITNWRVSYYVLRTVFNFSNYPQSWDLFDQKFQELYKNVDGGNKVYPIELISNAK